MEDKERGGRGEREREQGTGWYFSTITKLNYIICTAEIGKIHNPHNTKHLA